MTKLLSIVKTNKRKIVLLLILLIYIACIFLINDPQEIPVKCKTSPQTEAHIDSLLTYKELFEFKKEALFHQATSMKDNRLNSMNQRWQLRFLLGTLSALLLGISATAKDDSKKSLKKAAKDWRMVAASVSIFLLFFWYDCHIGHIWESVNKLGSEISQQMKDLPNKSYDSLMTLPVFQSISKQRRCEKKSLAPNSPCLAWVKWQLEKLKVSWRKKGDFLPFYGIVLLMFYMSMRILLAPDPNKKRGRKSLSLRKRR